jgi:hypothetical protein
MRNRVMEAVRGVAHTFEAVTSQCGHFNKQWSARPAANSPLPQFWEGEWRSDKNQHHGRLRCVLTKSADGAFLAFFRAKYSRFLRACYKVELRASRSGDLLRLSGKTDLGPLAGGEYTYEGSVQGREFLCRYKCRYDEGKFYLKAIRRVAAEEGRLERFQPGQVSNSR